MHVNRLFSMVERKEDLREGTEFESSHKKVTMSESESLTSDVVN